MADSKGRSLLVVLVVWLVIIGSLAAGYRYGVAPWLANENARENAVADYDGLVERAASKGIAAPPVNDDTPLETIEQINRDLLQRLTSAAGDERPIEHRVALALDSFTGYAVLRSPEFQRRLADQRIAVDLVDDGADYSARFQSLADGRTPLAVFTVDALLRTAAASGRQPSGTVVMVIDETVGADAIVAKKSGVPNVDALNNSAARILAVPDSPSDTLARVMLANFALPQVDASAIAPVGSMEDAFTKLRSAASDQPVAVALWEPYVTRALALPDVHVLIDSSRFRGYIVDVLVVQRQFLLNNEPVVRDIVASYFAAAHHYSNLPNGWTQLVRDDTRRLGDPLTAEQAERMVKSIWWKNTLENYAHFGLEPIGSGSGVVPLDRVISNLTSVLQRTGATDRDPLDGRPGLLYYDGVLAAMQRDRFHPAGASQGGQLDAVRQVEEAKALPAAQWRQLAPVGTIDTGRLVFARGTARLTGVSERLLDRLVETLDTWPSYYVRVRGHARSIGDAKANRLLAQQRADAAVAYLVKAGVSPARLRAVVAPELGSGGAAQAVTFEFGQLPY